MLTQNYKAEFDQVSSAAITAVTKSGTNRLQFEAYADRTGTNWRSLTVFGKSVRRTASPSALQQEGVRLQRRRPDQGPGALLLRLRRQKIDDSRQVVPRDRQAARQCGHRAHHSWPPRAATSTASPSTCCSARSITSDEQRLRLLGPRARESDHLPSRSASRPRQRQGTARTTRPASTSSTSGSWRLAERGPRRLRDYHWNPRSAATTAFVSTRSPPPIRRALTPRRTCSSPAVAGRARPSPEGRLHLRGAQLHRPARPRHQGRRQAQVDEVRTGGTSRARSISSKR